MGRYSYKYPEGSNCIDINDIGGEWREVREGKKEKRQRKKEEKKERKEMEERKKREKRIVVAVEDVVSIQTLYERGVIEMKSTAYFEPNEEINKKISIWKGDITTLQVDAIVNAANSSLFGGAGVDGAIHSIAGYELSIECKKLNGCDPGDAKITKGYRLPAKNIIHTVGPWSKDEEKLRSCYKRCFDVLKENQLRSIAFCCIATGIYGFPNEHAARIALDETRQWLETDNNISLVDNIIFCLYLPKDDNIYKNLCPSYFPMQKIA